MALRMKTMLMIGDCENSSFHKPDGSIDWLCWPRLELGRVFRRTAWNIRQWPLATRPKVSTVGSGTALSPRHTHPRNRISHRDRHRRSD